MGELNKNFEKKYPPLIDPYLLNILEKGSISSINFYSKDLEDPFFRAISNPDLRDLLIAINPLDLLKLIEVIKPPIKRKPFLIFNSITSENSNPLSIVIPEITIISFSRENNYKFVIKNEFDIDIFIEEPVIIQKGSEFITEEIFIPLDTPSSTYKVFFNDEKIVVLKGVSENTSLDFNEKGKNIAKSPLNGIFWKILSNNVSINPNDAILDILYLSGEWEDYYAVKLDGDKKPQIDNQPPNVTIKVVWDENPIMTYISPNTNKEAKIFNHFPILDIQTNSIDTYNGIRVLINGILVPQPIFTDYNIFSDNLKKFFKQILDDKGSGIYAINLENIHLNKWKENREILILKDIIIKYHNLSPDVDIFLPSLYEPKIEMEFINADEFSISAPSLSKKIPGNGFKFEGKREEKLHFIFSKNLHTADEEKYEITLEIPELTWRFKKLEEPWRNKQEQLNQDEYEKLDIFRNIEIKGPKRLLEFASLYISQNPDDRISKKFRNGNAIFRLGTIEYSLPKILNEFADINLGFVNKNNIEITAPIFRIQLWRITNYKILRNKLENDWILDLSWEENFKTETVRRIIVWSKTHKLRSEPIPNNEYSLSIRFSELELKEFNKYYIQFIRGEDYVSIFPENAVPNIFSLFHVDPELEDIVIKLDNEVISDDDFYQTIQNLLNFCKKDDKNLDVLKSLIEELFILRKRIDFFIDKLNNFIGCGESLSDEEITILIKVIQKSILPYLIQCPSDISSSVAYCIVNFFVIINEKNSSLFNDLMKKNCIDFLLIFFLSCENYLDVYIHSEVWSPISDNTLEKDQQLCIVRLAQCVDNCSFNNCIHAINEIFQYQKSSGHTIQVDELLYYFILVFLCINKSTIENCEEIDYSLIHSTLMDIERQKTDNSLVTTLLHSLQDFQMSNVSSQYTDEVIKSYTLILEKMKDCMVGSKS